MNSVRYFVLFHARTVAYLLVTAVFAIGLWANQRSNTEALKAEQRLTAERIVASQIDACARGNRLRAAVNEDTAILRYAFTEIATATAKRPGTASKVRAGKYAAIAKALIDVNVPDCSKVVYHP